VPQDSVFQKPLRDFTGAESSSVLLLLLLLLLLLVYCNSIY
jgi:hypothetical protein